MKYLLVLLAAFVFMGAGCNQQEQPPAEQPPVAETPTPSEEEMVRVEAPMPGDLIASPVVVRGEARGNWYFEASFPVRVFDALGRELGVGVAQAQGEWMTEEFVPFEVIVSFTNPETPTGYILLIKDNPSGLPEFDDQVLVPVKFRP
jgi:hypothetical protein